MYEVLVTDIDLPLDYMTYRADIFKLALLRDHFKNRIILVLLFLNVKIFVNRQG